jgi:hypothetical protein
MVVRTNRAAVSASDYSLAVADIQPGASVCFTSMSAEDSGHIEALPLQPTRSFGPTIHHVTRNTKDPCCFPTLDSCATDNDSAFAALRRSHAFTAPTVTASLALLCPAMCASKWSSRAPICPIWEVWHRALFSAMHRLKLPPKPTTTLLPASAACRAMYARQMGPAYIVDPRFVMPTYPNASLLAGVQQGQMQLMQPMVPVLMSGSIVCAVTVATLTDTLVGSGAAHGTLHASTCLAPRSPHA